MIRTTATRVQEATDETIDQEILRTMEQRISYYAAHKDQISQRLWQLDREWDMERAIGVTASSLGLLGLVLGTLRSRRWFLLPFGATAFLLQNAVRGWSPPLPILRRFGVRTASQIEQERYALKILRGDFQISDIEGKTDLERVASIVQSVSRR